MRKWLESSQRDYAAGVALFEAHGRSSVLKRLLSGPASDYTREVLVRELTKLTAPVLCDGHVISGPKKVAAVPAKAEILRDLHVTEAPNGEELRRQRRKLFADRDYLHASLELLPTEKERLAASLQLLESVKRIQLSYDVAAGRVVDPAPAPGPDLAAITDAGEVRRLLANLKPLRSKLKNRPDRADKLAEVEADIHLLEAKLKP
ncbi:hypothetical protein [Hymenobacter sp.]|uniref:hypothetical protein n=1 Tax=Hymenobacter sp. TaxID=1898978 RepID=UPI00286D66F8|nr:hypothetical protein [Hymenobacter sp.]